MAQTKIYPATQTQAQNIQTTVDEINAKTVPVTLADIETYVLDFINDDINM